MILDLALPYHLIKRRVSLTSSLFNLQTVPTPQVPIVFVCIFFSYYSLCHAGDALFLTLPCMIPNNLQLPFDNNWTTVTRRGKLNRNTWRNLLTNISLLLGSLSLEISPFRALQVALLYMISVFVSDNLLQHHVFSE